ncbi:MULTISPECIES: hypothetical protein [unclassified Brevundimonas]|uniref:hypothetical protein n=1 Tax=unclassified Brevundimonas TaxID=2622653 RepID=UPI0011B064ED|nr:MULTISPECIES: hypothetical protein [unclassified Brevundimonas]
MINDKTTDPSGPDAVQPQPRRLHWLGILAAAFGAVLIYNLMVWIPAATALSHDDRNKVASVHVYRSWLVHPRNITVDLIAIDGAATIDLTRALFQTAEALKDRKFGQVVLARQGKPVFIMEGPAFVELGQQYAAGQNPVYLIRTLPEQLYRPDGSAAFGTWSGGWLGVLGKQMEDVNMFGEAWANGQTGLRHEGYR